MTLFDPEHAGWKHLEVGAFLQHIGPIWVRRKPDGLQFGLMAQDFHANSRGIVNGGVIMSLADIGVGKVAEDALNAKNPLTIQLDVQFISPARLGSFMIVRSTVLRATKSLAFVRGEIFCDEITVAAVTGIWKNPRPQAPAK